MMKKLLFTALLPIFLLQILFFGGIRLSHSAQADDLASPPKVGDYACVLNHSTYFYSAPDERRGIFLLPETYYVRLMEYGAEYCKIEYQTDSASYRRLIGYAKTNLLTFVDYTPVRPYLSYVFDVKYKIEYGEFTNSSFLTELTVSCAYYGDFLVGSETYCYVLQDTEFGYVPKPIGFSFEENTEYADYLASLETVAPSDPEPPQEQSRSSSPAQIAILIALCLLVPLLATLILRPPRKPPYETDDTLG
ncbi:MAG: hypothetical protein J6A38_02085 [Clostridia bacterium]|nr:hypothetical protein [Clostridia bacterium]